MKMKNFTPLLSLGMALCAFNFAHAQSYTQPYQTVPTAMHAATQSLYSVNVSIDGNTVMTYTDSNGRQAYNWLQDEYSFTAKKDKKLHLMFVQAFGHGTLLLVSTGTMMVHSKTNNVLSQK